MVDVGGKPITQRTALARGEVELNETAVEAIEQGRLEKGDVLAVAQVAGITAAKRTADLIPLCHPVPVFAVDVKCVLDMPQGRVEIEATVKAHGTTGVEMEALTAVSVAALTIYDMCKSLDRGITITNVRLIEKTGGQRGDYHRVEGT